MYPDSSKYLNYETDDTVYWFCTAFDPLNNWSAHTVMVWCQSFQTVEHAYHYRKYTDTAPDVARQIRSAPSPWAVMRIAHQYQGKRREDWDDIKVDIMTEIVRAKVAQNEDVRTCLKQTGRKKLVENSPWDKFWGCGEDGKGQNQMGRIMMGLREELELHNTSD